MAEPGDKGVIGEIREDGLPVVYKFVNELPPESTREQFGWLTVISWKYDGSGRNGMPAQDVNARMLDLEHAIDSGLEQRRLCRHAYSRTGNHLKELAYYITDRTEFIDAFNETLASHAPYPIEITFYEDRAWQDFQTIRGLFKRDGSGG